MEQTWGSVPKERTVERSANRIAFIVAAVFGAVGLGWVLITDVLLYELTRESTLIARIETAKGWTFVALGAVLVYAVTRYCAGRLSRSQGALTAIIESIADGVLLLGPDRRIRRANAAAARMLGCESLVGMDADEFSRRFRVSYPNGFLVPPSQFISQRVFDEGGPLHYKAILHPSDGSELVISATAAAVRLEGDARADMVVSVMHDITSSDHFDRLRDQFLASAAHALKTPMAVIKANAQVLVAGDAQSVGRSAAAIGRQCDRVDLLVQNLIVFTRIRSNTLRLHPSDIALRPIIERVARTMATGSANHDLRSDLRAAPRVHADEERLSLALRNLIDEAFRLSVAGTTITVLLAPVGRDAKVGVRYRPPAPHEQSRAASYVSDELALQRLVSKTIVECHGGALCSEAASREKMVWFNLPVLEGSA